MRGKFVVYLSTVTFKKVDFLISNMHKCLWIYGIQYPTNKLMYAWNLFIGFRRKTVTKSKIIIGSNFQLIPELTKIVKFKIYWSFINWVLLNIFLKEMKPMSCFLKLMLFDNPPINSVNQILNFKLNFFIRYTKIP